MSNQHRLPLPAQRHVARSAEETSTVNVNQDLVQQPILNYPVLF